MTLIISLLKNVKNKLYALMDYANKYGVPIPLVRDSDKQQGSITATLTLLTALIYAGGLIGKISHALGDVDLTEARNFFLICFGAYTGRKFTTDGKKISLDGKHKKVKDK